MAEDIRRPGDKDDFVNPDEPERGIGESDEDLDEEDEDLVEEDEEGYESSGIGADRALTAEIGSEGGSPGDLEAERRKPRVTGGSEATTTAETDERPAFNDRRAGGTPGKSQ